MDGGTTVERASEGSWKFTGENSRTFTAKCTINSYKCAAGKYLPKNKTSCATCTAGNYCIGGTFKFNTSTNQGITACPGSYKNGGTGAKTINECIMNVSENKYVKKAKDLNATACAAGYISSAHIVKYGNVSTCNLDKTPSGSVKTPSIFYLEYRDRECNTNHTMYSSTDFKNYPYRRYFIHSYTCECQLNSGGRYIGNYKNGTPAPDERDIHPDDDMTIYYDKDKYGIKACDGYYVNQYITNICSEHFQNGLVETIDNTNYIVGNIHGYRWYDKGPGAAAAYHNFITSGKGWFHSDGRYDNRYVPSDTPDYNDTKQRKEACHHVCSFY